MTELSFLIELLLNHRFKKETKQLIAERIMEVQLGHVPMSVQMSAPNRAVVPPRPLAAIAPPVPVEHIAQNPVTQAAMAQRNQTIADAMSGKVDKTRTSPKKF